MNVDNISIPKTHHAVLELILRLQSYKDCQQPTTYQARLNMYEFCKFFDLKLYSVNFTKNEYSFEIAFSYCYVQEMLISYLS